VDVRESMASLLEQSLGKTLENISQQQVPTAGGSSAALVGALAASLTSMVAHSAGDDWEDAGSVIAQAETLQARLCILVSRDAEAYGEARVLLHKAGEDPERRGIGASPGSVTPQEERDLELASALWAAAGALVRIAEAAADVAALAAWAVEAAGIDERADALVAASLAEAAAFGAAQLVLVNLAVRPIDELAMRAQAAARAAAESRSRALENI